MAVKTNYGAPLTGLDAELAAQPIADFPRGLGGSSGVSPPSRGDLRAATSPIMGPDAAEQQTNRFAGLGELLEADDETAFKALHDLNLRQERLARNRLAQDKHWTRIKQGYQWSALERVQDQDIYRAVLPPGSGPLRPAAVPNKAADLCNKLVETLMVDPPQPAPKPDTDEESAARAAEIAQEFLSQDGGEGGTDDAAAFWYSVDAATARTCAFHHYWVDATGGGSVGQQIKAHPQAVDANNPLVGPPGPDGVPAPTTDYILRYVTEDGQFTDDPSQAARQWLPKIRIERWGREHVRLFPEDRDLAQCTAILGLYYCTLDEGRRRWDTVAALDAEGQQALCDWTPPRYLVLLPPALRARWKLQVGGEKNIKGGSGEQRMFFYYAYHHLQNPDYPKGATLYASGAFDGLVLERDTLTADVPAAGSARAGTDLKAMDLPLVEVRLIQDADDRDPTGTPFMARIGGANEAAGTLCAAYLEAFDINLHPAVYTPGTSPVEGWQVEQARASGDHIPILGKDDKPEYEAPRTIPGNFIPMVEWVYEQMDSAASLNKPVTGSDTSKEVSGVARQTAVRQAMVALSRMQQALLAAYTRHWRIKLQLAMKHFTAPQMIRYVGEDGSYKQEWWTGVDFSRVTAVDVQSGTGTMMPPQDKVNYVAQLRQLDFLPQDDAADAARQSFTSTLGIPDDPQQQRIERQVSAWLEGPPDDQWVARYQQYVQAKAAYDAQQAQLAAQQAAAAQAQQQAQVRQQGQAQQAQAEADHSTGLRRSEEVHRQKMRHADESQAIRARVA